MRNWDARTFKQFKTGRRRSGRLGKMKPKPSISRIRKIDKNIKRGSK